MATDKPSTWKNPVPSLYELNKYYGDAPVGSMAYVISLASYYTKTGRNWVAWQPSGAPSEPDTTTRLFGTHSFRTLAERDALPVSTKLDGEEYSGERHLFMPVWVAETKRSYVLHIDHYDQLSAADQLAALADNKNWVEYASPGGGSGDTSFNWNRPITLAGAFYGIVAGGTSLGEGLGNLLFPAEAPAASLSAVNGTREFGAPPQVTLNWSVQARTNPVTSIIVNGVKQALAASGTTSAATALNVDTTFSMSVSTGSENATASTSVNYRHYRFWFASATDLLKDSATSLSTRLNALSTKEFGGNRQMSRDFTLTGQYIYFAYLDSYGDAAFVVGGLPNTAYQHVSFSYTNASGFTTPFRLYRSGNAGTGSIGVQLQ